ncbi:MAG: hypothetical protein MH825_13095 [Cyanobacteria bacterium]|nr:hypothetical protein [Cyanobacteriota bacterium]
MADSIHQTHTYGVAHVATAAGITATGIRKVLIDRIKRIAPDAIATLGENGRGVIYGFTAEALEIAESYRNRGILTPDQWEAQYIQPVQAEVCPETTGSALAVLPKYFRDQADVALEVARDAIWDYQNSIDEEFQAELQAAYTQGEREGGMLLSARIAGRRAGLGKLQGDRAAAAQGGA